MPKIESLVVFEAHVKDAIQTVCRQTDFIKAGHPGAASVIIAPKNPALPLAHDNVQISVEWSSSD